jgi:hypothetical protein
MAKNAGTAASMKCSWISGHAPLWTECPPSSRVSACSFCQCLLFQRQWSGCRQASRDVTNPNDYELTGRGKSSTWPECRRRRDIKEQSRMRHPRWLPWPMILLLLSFKDGTWLLGGSLRPLVQRLARCRMPWVRHGAAAPGATPGLSRLHALIPSF